MHPIRVLIITGENNHDWKRTSVFCKGVLEKSGKFLVDVTDTPLEVLSTLEQLGQYQLFLLDYNGSDWSDLARQNFLSSISNGTGVVILHASNNSFPEWTQYETLIGVVWRDESGHGEFHEFEVNVVDSDHPISRGMSRFRTRDELYHHLVPSPDADYQVIATAYSDPERGGSGRHEPVWIVLEYGKGRVFHNVLGHAWPDNPTGDYEGYTLMALENEGFQQSLLRGCEWAATGSIEE